MDAQITPPPAWYAVLGVSPFAGVEEIRESFKKRISKCHPDKVNHLDEDSRNRAEREAKLLTSAYREGLSIRGLQR
jgi:preprotein translocase subunit Sec63